MVPAAGAGVLMEGSVQDTTSHEEEDWVCDGYPEHDYVLRDEADGDRVYDCRRCGAELIESDSDV